MMLQDLVSAMRLIVSGIVVVQELIDHRDVFIGFFVVWQVTAFFEPDELRSGNGVGHCPGDVGGHVQIEAALDHKCREVEVRHLRSKVEVGKGLRDSFASGRGKAEVGSIGEVSVAKLLGVEDHAEMGPEIEISGLRVGVGLAM
jgi:hypothetical protein